MRLILLLMFLLLLGGCAGPRMLWLEDQSHRPGLAPPEARRTSLDMDPTVIEWDSANDPGIWVAMECRGSVAEIREWYDKNLAKQGWEQSWTNDDGSYRNFTRIEFLKPAPHSIVLSKQTMDLAIYSKPDAENVTIIKLEIRWDNALDWPSRAVGLGLSWICFGWMGEAAQIVWPVEALFRVMF